jgi:hypothetical protein
MHAIATKYLRISLLVAFVAAFFAHSQGFVHAQPAANSPAEATSRAPVLVTRFNGKLSTKTAKEGDPVTANVVQVLKLADLEIPKGSKIVGIIASVKSKDAGSGNSTLAIKFDHIELKTGAILRVQGLIVAIGQVATAPGLGFNSILGRGGVGSTPGLDPNTGNDVNRDDIPAGSSLVGVALGRNLDAAGATELRGVRTEIKFDPSVMIKVALFHGA